MKTFALIYVFHYNKNAFTKLGLLEKKKIFIYLFIYFIYVYIYFFFKKIK